MLASLSLVTRQKRTVADYLGSILTRNWKRPPRREVETVGPGTLAETLLLHQETFDSLSDRIFKRYSSIFRHVFYISRLENRVVGYCVNYIRLSLTQSGLVRTAVIYALGVDGRYRRQGIGTQLLDASVREMRLNKIDEVRLYVSRDNSPALSLYRLYGFVVVREVADICGPGERCYEMRLAISGRG